MNKKQCKRSFRKLKSSMSNEKFLIFCEDVSNQYAIRGMVYATKFYTENYYISVECLNKILAYSIICNLVSEDIVNKIEISALKYSELLPADYVSKMKNHYKFLRKVRYKFIISTFPKERALCMLNEYSSSSDISKDEIAEKYQVNSVIIDSILQKTILNNTIPDKTLEEIEKIFVLKDPTNTNISFFEKIREERNLRRTAIE